MKQNLPYIFLILGCIAYTLCCGIFNIAICAWIWPFMLLYFMRNTTGKKSLLLILPVLMIGYSFKFFGILGDIGFATTALTAVLGLTCAIPFIIDKIFYKKVLEPWNTLIFPLSWAAFEVIKSYTFLGAMGNIAYSQTGNLPLLQMTSVFGSFGLTVLILWFGSILMYACEHKWKWQEVKRPCCIYLGIFIACCGFGGARLLTNEIYDETATVACAYGPELRYFEGEYEVLPLEDNMRSMEKAARESAVANADILMWCEEAFCIQDYDYDKLVGRAQTLAKQNEMYYIFPIEVIDNDDSEDGLSLNMQLIITPEGKIIDSYEKNKLVPLVESGYYVDGNEVADVHETPFGRIASVICFDCTFTHYINKVCSKGVDTLFVPSWDWIDLFSYNTRDVEFRAIENGVNLIRTTYDGLSEAVDAKGRVLAASNTFSSGFEYIQYVQVPTEGVTTVYSKIGTVIAWLYVAGLVVLVVVGMKRRKSRD